VTPALSTPERRPLATRDRRWAVAAAGWLARRGASPNAISLAGLLAATLAGAALAATPHVAAGWGAALFLAAAGLIVTRLLANMFDGMVALQTGQSSPVGELFNEVPDRVSDVAVLLGAGYAAGGRPELGYLAACLALFIAYVRAEGKVAGAPQDYGGPMAKQQRMACVIAACLLSAFLPASLGVMAWALGVILAGGLLTAALRLCRIAAALRRAGA
jgi:phosphatidylglycerophosphate synthase